MNLEFDDYGAITIVMDDVKYELKKENIGFSIKECNGETINVNGKECKKVILDSEKEY